MNRDPFCFHYKLFLSLLIPLKSFFQLVFGSFPLWPFLHWIHFFITPSFNHSPHFFIVLDVLLLLFIFIFFPLHYFNISQTLFNFTLISKFRGSKKGEMERKLLVILVMMAVGSSWTFDQSFTASSPDKIYCLDFSPNG